MSQPLDRHGNLLPLLPAGLLLGSILACTPPSKDLATALIAAADGHRPVQPRLVGFEFSPCELSDDFIPRGSCDAAGSLASRLQDPAWSSFFGDSSGGVLDSQDLYGQALWRMLVTPSNERALRRAVLDMSEAVTLAEDPPREADRRSDLAAAHLLLAEHLQSAAQVALALESSMAALDIVPHHAEAAFNRDLAMRWLGLAHTVDEADGDPWVQEQQRYWQATAETEDGVCWDRGQLRSALEQWSNDGGVEPPGWLETQQTCWSTSQDRLFADLLGDLARNPQVVAADWRRMGEVRALLGSAQERALADGFTMLRRSSIPALRLASLYFEVIHAYLGNDYALAQRLNERLIDEAGQRSYLEMEARAHRQQALQHEILGDFGRSLRRLQAAVGLAERADSPQHVATFRTLLIEVWMRQGQPQEAWLEISRALRTLGTETYPDQRLIALGSAAQLAAEQDLNRLAAWLRHRAVDEAADIGPAEEVTALKSRGGFLADRGLSKLALRDLDRARQILAEAPLSEGVRQTLELDLLHLEGRVATDPRRRLEAMEGSVEGYRQTDYDRQLVVAQRRLARQRLAQGQRRRAKTDLEAAFAELQQQVGSFEHWAAAVPLVASGRTLVGDLLALHLEDGDTERAVALLSAFLDLRHGRTDRDDPLPARAEDEGQRLAYFVRDAEVLIFMQRDGETLVRRYPVERRRLLRDRQRLIQELESQVELPRLEATLRNLAALLLDAVAADLHPGRPLEIVADDVLAGLPFHLLPMLPAPDSPPLLERFVVSYGTDLRPPPSSETQPISMDSMLAIGFGDPSADLSPLPEAEEEAQQVAALYAGSNPLLGDLATADAVLAALPENGAVHVAAHLVVDEAQPMDSYLALAGDSGRLTVKQLMASKGEGLRLLYLSACDGGRGFDTATHGLGSLAQAFTDQGIETTVLSLWPLDDATGSQLAVAFHRQLLHGASPAEALQSAQLAMRDRHPRLWAGLVVYR